jgi:signal transduction histidine kinase
MKSLTRFLLALVAAFGLSVAFAEDHGTKEEAKTMADAAVAYIKKVGPEKACDDFMKDKATWTKKDLYVFVFDLEGLTKAHGANEKLVGKSLAGLKDQNGKEFIKAMIDVAKGHGEGWVDYDWANPLSKKVEGKSSYVERVAGKDLFVGVGIYR